MRPSTLRKTVACAAAALVAVLMLNASVAESHDAATARGSVNAARRSVRSTLSLTKSAKKTAKAPAYVAPTYPTLASLLQSFDSAPVRAIVPTVSAPKARAQGVTVQAAAPVAPSRRLLPIADNPDFTQRHRELADAVLRLLPSGCRDNLTNFYIRYDNPAQRGLGGKNTIILSGNVPDNEFVALLVHECWHVITASLDGTPGTAPSVFRDGSQVFYGDSETAAFFAISWQTQDVRREGSTDADFATIYGKTDPFEDLAEFGIAFAIHRQWLEKRAETNPVIRAKLDWMRRQYPDGLAPATSAYAGDAKVPWDATKLPFTWNETLAASMAGR